MTVPRRAIIAVDGVFTYDDLDEASKRVAGSLLADNDDLNQTRVAFLVHPSFAYAAVQRGIWRAGGVAVPLAVSHPPAELEYVIRDSGAGVVVADEASAATLMPIARAVHARFVAAEDALHASPADGLPHLGSNRRAMIIYTSGTTGRPKGVVSTHQNIGAQIASLVEAWRWSPADSCCSCSRCTTCTASSTASARRLRCGRRARSCRRSTPNGAGTRLASGEVTVFTAVPTIYNRLIASWEAAAPDVRRQRSDGVRGLRLMMSGSAALPVQDTRTMARDQRPHAARALRHDRDRHGALESA